jgi:hypothetical protein
VLRRIFEVLHPRDATPEARAAGLLENVKAKYWMEIEPLTKANLRACADTMRAIADQWKDDSGEAAREGNDKAQRATEQSEGSRSN